MPKDDVREEPLHLPPSQLLSGSSCLPAYASKLFCICQVTRNRSAYDRRVGRWLVAFVCSAVCPRATRYKENTGVNSKQTGTQRCCLEGTGGGGGAAMGTKHGGASVPGAECPHYATAGTTVVFVIRGYMRDTYSCSLWLAGDHMNFSVLCTTQQWCHQVGGTL